MNIQGKDKNRLIRCWCGHYEFDLIDDGERFQCQLCGNKVLASIAHYYDSTNHLISVGDRVSFRGRVYTIRAFGHGKGVAGTAAIYFEEAQHIDEIADEISVDLVDFDEV